MNNSRRKRISGIVSKLEELMADIEDVQSDEETTFDSLPESFQSGEKGDKMQTAIDYLDSAKSVIEDSIDNLNLAAE